MDLAVTRKKESRRSVQFPAWVAESTAVCAPETEKGREDSSRV